MSEPEKLIPLHRGYRKLKSFQEATLESRGLPALLVPKLLSGELRVTAAIFPTNIDHTSP
jgi:hypothetical protein